MTLKIVKVLALVTSALTFACGTVGAQQSSPGSATPEMRQSERPLPGQYFGDDDDDVEWRTRHRGDGDYGPAWRRHRQGQQSEMMPMMGHGMGRQMMRMMMILMDTDGSGSISLQEFQAGHERMFKAMDANNDASLSIDEVRGFHRSMRTPER